MVTKEHTKPGEEVFVVVRTAFAPKEARALFGPAWRTQIVRGVVANVVRRARARVVRLDGLDDVRSIATRNLWSSRKAAQLSLVESERKRRHRDWAFNALSAEGGADDGHEVRDDEDDLREAREYLTINQGLRRGNSHEDINENEAGEADDGKAGALQANAADADSGDEAGEHVDAMTLTGQLGGHDRLRHGPGKGRKRQHTETSSLEESLQEGRPEPSVAAMSQGLPAVTLSSSSSSSSAAAASSLSCSSQPVATPATVAAGTLLATSFAGRAHAADDGLHEGQPITDVESEIVRWEVHEDLASEKEDAESGGKVHDDDIAGERGPHDSHMDEDQCAYHRRSRAAAPEAHMVWPDDQDTNDRPAIEFFRAYFLQGSFLRSLIEFTDENLGKVGEVPMRGTDELLQYCGLLLNMSLYNGVEPADCWSGKQSSLVSYPNFSATMSSRRFRAVTAALAFAADEDTGSAGEQGADRGRVEDEESPPDRGPLHRHEDLRFLLEGFNEARLKTFRAGPLLVCGPVEDAASSLPLSAMAGLGPLAHIPAPVSRERSSRGCRLHGLFCAQTGIVLRLEAVEGVWGPGRPASDPENTFGALVLERLVSPICRREEARGDIQERVICSEAVYAGLKTAVAVKNSLGADFIGELSGSAWTSMPPARDPRGRASRCMYKTIMDGVSLHVFEPTDACPRVMLSTMSEKPSDTVLGALSLPKWHQNFRLQHLQVEELKISRRWEVGLFAAILSICVADAFVASRYFCPRTSIHYAASIDAFRVSLIAQLRESSTNAVSPTGEQALPDTAPSDVRATAIVARIWKPKMILEQLALLNREHRLWRDPYPNPRCKDCMRLSKSPVHRGSKHCILCTNEAKVSAGTNTLIGRQVHALCKNCEREHVAMHHRMRDV